MIPHRIILQSPQGEHILNTVKKLIASVLAGLLLATPVGCARHTETTADIGPLPSYNVSSTDASLSSWLTTEVSANPTVSPVPTPTPTSTPMPTLSPSPVPSSAPSEQPKSLSEDIFFSLCVPASMNDFLPEGLTFEKVLQSNIIKLDYSTGIHTTDLPRTHFGEQMTYFYEIGLYLEDAKYHMASFYKSEKTLLPLLQNYIDEHPDNHAYFSLIHEEVSYEFIIMDLLYKVSFETDEGAMELSTVPQSGEIYGRLRRNDGTVIGFAFSSERMTVAYYIPNEREMRVNFVKTTSDSATATLHRVSMENGISKELIAFIHLGPSYSYIVGNAAAFEEDRNANDRTVEVYDSTTGRYLGSGTTKHSDNEEYSYYSVPLYYFSGISNIRITGENQENVRLNEQETAVRFAFDTTESGETVSRWAIISVSQNILLRKKTYGHLLERYQWGDILLPMLVFKDVACDSFAEEFRQLNEIDLIDMRTDAEKSALTASFIGGIEVYEALDKNFTTESIEAFLRVEIV